MEVMTFELGLEGSKKPQAESRTAQVQTQGVHGTETVLVAVRSLVGLEQKFPKDVRKENALVRLKDVSIAGEEDRLGEGKSGARHDEQLGSHSSGQGAILRT